MSLRVVERAKRVLDTADERESSRVHDQCLCLAEHVAEVAERVEALLCSAHGRVGATRPQVHRRAQHEHHALTPPLTPLTCVDERSCGQRVGFVETTLVQAYVREQALAPGHSAFVAEAFEEFHRTGNAALGLLESTARERDPREVLPRPGGAVGVADVFECLEGGEDRCFGLFETAREQIRDTRQAQGLGCAGDVTEPAELRGGLAVERNGVVEVTAAVLDVAQAQPDVRFDRGASERACLRVEHITPSGGELVLGRMDAGAFEQDRRAFEMVVSDERDGVTEQTDRGVGRLALRRTPQPADREVVDVDR